MPLQHCELLACADDEPCGGEIPDGSLCESCMTRTDPSIAGMGYLGDVSQSTKEASLWDIYTGKAAEMLNDQKTQVADLDARLNTLRDSWNSMPEGPAKTQAFQNYQQANASVIDIKTKLNPAIRAYNDIANWMRYAPGSGVSPENVNLQMSGMGVLPAVIEAAIVAIAIAEVLRVFSGWWAGGQAAINASRGLLDQFAGVIQQGGGAIKETGNLALKIAGAAAIGVVVFLGYKWFTHKKLQGA